MSKVQYGFVLIVALVAGLIGEVVGSRLFPPRVFRALRFEAVDKRGEIRMALDKSGLTFFPREGETAPVALDAETASLHLYGHNAGDRVEVSAVKRVLRLSDAEGKILWEVPAREEPSESGAAQDLSSTAPALPQSSPELPTGAPVAPAAPPHKKLPHPACPQCFTYDCPGCYTIFEEVPGTGVILTREIPNPAPQLPEGVRMHDNAGRPIWYIGRQPYVGPTDEEPFSPELPIPLIELKRIQARHHKEIFSIPGVHGFGIGAKGFVVFLLPEQRDHISQIPKVLEGVPVEVEIRGMAVLLNQAEQEGGQR